MEYGVTTILPPVFLIGALLNGINGLAWAMLITQVGIFVPAWWFLIRPLCGASLLEYIGQLAPPLFIGLVASGCAQAFVMSIEHGLLRLALGLAVGAVVYLALSTWFNQTWIAGMKELLGIRKTLARNTT